MSVSPSTSASTPTSEAITLPDPLGHALQLPPPQPSSTPSPRRDSSLLPPRYLASSPNGHDMGADRTYLDAAEQELLEEIQLVQSKLIESRHRNALQKNRRLLRRNPSVSDSIMNMASDTDPNVALRELRQKQPSVLGNGHAERPERAPRQRIISVSFRLPKKEHRESVRQQLFDSALPPKAIFSLQSSSDFPFVWVGIAGSHADVEPANFEDVYGEEHRAPWRSLSTRESDGQKRRKSRYVPVVFPDGTSLLQNFDLYSEETLWPLLHYQYTSVGAAGDLEELWNAYRVINQRFAEAISEIYEEGDLIWIHNYHLMLLPGLLRESLWYAKIGFFLYTPFPSAEIFRILPQRTELLRGLIGADLIGFHSYDYSKQFVSSCTRLLGIDGNPNSIEADPRVGRRCEIGIYPGGIDVRALKSHLSSKQVKSRVAEMRARFEGRKILVGVDRLDDCFAGIPLKLLAYEKLLADNSDLVGNVVLIQVAMLPKQAKNVASYRAQQMQINEFVGRVNSSFGTLAFSPIHYINTELSPTELYALMSVGHVCIVSNIRGGMDLVPHEWVVCQHGGNKGPIVLSEFSGSAQSFATSLHVNPWDVDEMAAKMKVALDMGTSSRTMRNEAAYRFVTTHTASLWGFNFLEDLEQSDGATGTATLGTPPLQIASVLHAYTKSSAQPSPVSSSTVLSSMNSSFSQGTLSPGLHGEKLSHVIRGAFGPSSIIGTIPSEQVGARLGDLLLGEGIPKKSISSPLDQQDPSWISPDASNRLKKMRKANLFVLDLDGTLVQFQAIAKLGVPTQHVLDLIQSLLDASPMNFVLIVSSRDRHTLLQWLGELNVFICAEDGAFFRAPGALGWTPLFRDSSNHSYSVHHSPSGPYPLSTKSSNSSAELNIQVSEDLKGEDAAFMNGSRREVEDFDGMKGEKPPKKHSLSVDDGRHRGSAQSIISLNNEGSLITDSVVLAWKSAIRPVMQHFAERTPGVVVEEGDATLTWHYVDADKDFGLWQARDLYKHLESFLLQNLNIELISEEGRRKWIKVHPNGVDKTAAVVKTLEYIRDNSMRDRREKDDAEEEARPSIEFVLCIGDDRADEGMFEFFRDEKRLENLNVHCSQSRIFTCRVGCQTTTAKWFVESSQRVVELLEEITAGHLSQT